LFQEQNITLPLHRSRDILTLCTPVLHSHSYFQHVLQSKIFHFVRLSLANHSRKSLITLGTHSFTPSKLQCSDTTASPTHHCQRTWSQFNPTQSEA